MDRPHLAHRALVTRPALVIGCALLAAGLVSGCGSDENQAVTQAVAAIEALGGSVTYTGSGKNAKVTGVDLHGTLVTDEDLEHLQALPGITRLDLGVTDITDEGLNRLASLANLEQLYLRFTPINGTGLAAVPQKKLAKLELWMTKTNDAGLRNLKAAAALADLDLYSTPVTDAGLAALKDLKKLAQVDLRYTQVTAAGVAALKKGAPAAKVEFETP